MGQIVQTTDRLTKSGNLSDLANTTAARNNLGLGNVDNTSDMIKAAPGNPVGDAIAGVLTTVRLDSIAIFRSATIADRINTVIISGYYGINSPGGGTYVRDTNDTTTVDDAGSCIVKNGVRWKRLFPGGAIALADFGVSPAINDNGPGLRAAIAYAQGRFIFANPGVYQCLSGVDTTLPINIQGCGMGAGPGSAEQYSTQATLFILNYDSPTLFRSTSTRPNIFRDFQITVAQGLRPVTGGAGIEINAPRIAGSETTANSRIENVAFNHLHKGINLFSPGWITIHNCYFGDWVDSAIVSGTDADVEGSAGTISNNYFFGKLSNSQRACIHLRNGYTIIRENEILGAEIGILVDIANYPAGFVHIHDNTIEENYLYGIYFRKTGSSTTVAGSMWSIHHNEFSVITMGGTYAASVGIDENGGVPWLDDLHIVSNTTRHNLRDGRRHYFINAGRTISVHGNIMEELSGTDVIGIQMTGITSNGALREPIIVSDNLFRGINRRYIFASNGIITLRDMIPATVTQINNWGPVKDGSTAYASDGKATDGANLNYLLTGGGSGVSATKVRGSWFANFPISA